MAYLQSARLGTLDTQDGEGYGARFSSYAVLADHVRRGDPYFAVRGVKPSSVAALMVVARTTVLPAAENENG